MKRAGERARGGFVGSRLIASVVCAGLVSAGSARAQQPQPPQPQQPAGPGNLPSADVAKQGLDLYKAGDFVSAVAPLERALEMEPNNFEVHYALAQSLRQTGHCDQALPHYKALVDH